MKRAGLVVLGTWLLLAGSAIAQPPMPYPGVPELRPEVIPPPPGERYVWEPGHWHWNGAAYVWHGGHYVARQARYGQYVPGHWQWQPRRGAWVWFPAHWG